MTRCQLPVHSPLDVAALAGGLAAVLGARGVEEQVLPDLTARWGLRAVRLADSGTSALSLAIAASLAGRPAGERLVALPAYACYDVATAVDGAGVRAVLYDVDPATLGPDWDSLAAALRAGAGAVAVVHLYGVPVDLARVARMAADAGALLIEDAAQGAGAAWQGRPLGAHGSLAVLSFGRGKGITGGGGGALLANDARGAALLEALPPLPEGGSGLGVWARALAQWALARPSLYALPASLPGLGLGETVYHPPHPPRSIPRSALGILARTLALADAEAAVRRRVGARLRTVALTANLTTIAAPEGGEAGWLRFPVLLPSPARAAPLASGRRLGIMPGYPLPLDRLPGFGDGPRRVPLAGGYPGAAFLAERLITLPTHSRLTLRDLARLEAWMRGCPLLPS